MSSIIPIARLRNGGIAQLARACGSYPQCPRFESRCRYQKRRRYFYLRLNFGPLVKRLRHRPFTAVTWVRFPYGSPKISSSPFRWAAYFCIIYRESKGAVVNDMPGACQSRDPARPQARIPVWVKKKSIDQVDGLFLYLLCNDNESPVLGMICAGGEGEQLISGAYPNSGVV